MIRVAIVEDQAADAEVLRGCVSRWCEEHPEDAATCEVYSDAVAFLERGNGADIVFMDIEMPYMNGMSAAAELRRHNREAILIFATRATRYAVRGYSVDAIGYLVKPIGDSAFDGVFGKAVRLYRERSRESTVVLKTKDGSVTVRADRIRCIEADGHMLHIHTEGETMDVWCGIERMLETLPPEFVRCHKGYAVNLKHVSRVGKDSVTVQGQPEMVIPVSRQRRSQLMERLTRYYTRMMGE